jgi:hypothetical protein
LVSGAAVGRVQVTELVAVAAALNPCLPVVSKMRDMTVLIRILCSAHDPQRPSPALDDRIVEASREMTQLLQELRQGLQSTPYPFAHGSDGTCAADVVVRQMPKLDDPVEAHEVALVAVDAFCNLAFRVLALLAEWAERVEQAAGLSPLPEPAETDQEPPEAAAEMQRNTRRYWLGYGVRAVAGLTVLVGLVWFSVDPPILPSMPWQTISGTGYRPAAFHAPFRPYREPSVPMIFPPGYPRVPYPVAYPGQPHPGQPHPGQPSAYPPGHPMHRPAQPAHPPGYPAYPPGYQPPPPPSHGPYQPGSSSPYAPGGSPGNAGRSAPYRPSPGPYVPQPGPYRPAPGGPSPGGAPGRSGR